MLVPSTFPASSSSGMNTQAVRPLRAACAATAFARFPVEAQPIVSSPNAAAALIAADKNRARYTDHAAKARADQAVFFLDLHTTSAAGVPFALIGDTLAQRRFAAFGGIRVALLR